MNVIGHQQGQRSLSEVLGSAGVFCFFDASVWNEAEMTDRLCRKEVWDYTFSMILPIRLAI